jgi:hypothetical protein
LETIVSVANKMRPKGAGQKNADWHVVETACDAILKNP